MDRKQVASELVRVAKDLLSADLRFAQLGSAGLGRGYEEYEDSVSSDFRKLESIANKVVRKLESSFGGRYKVQTSTYISGHGPVGAYIGVKNAKNLTIFSIASKWIKMKPTTVPRSMGYVVKFFEPKKSSKAGVSSVYLPTSDGILKGLMGVRKKMGDDKFYKLLGLNPDDIASDAPTIGQIQKAIGNTWFDLEDSSSDSLLYVTRDNGDVGEEEYGQEDANEALRIKKLLLREFGSNNVEVSISPVDEWVNINIGIK